MALDQLALPREGDATLTAPFPYFGGKRKVAPLIWQRLGKCKQYTEPFAGSLAVLLANPNPIALEVVGDANGFIANFWRAVRHQPRAVAEHADRPVTHIDQFAVHAWLLKQRKRLARKLRVEPWPGDAKAAGLWCWLQCAWIGAGAADWERDYAPNCPGSIPHITGRGRGLTSPRRSPEQWIARLSERLFNVKVLHADWRRCLNTYYGRTCNGTAGIFLDPPYDNYQSLYGEGTRPVAQEVANWARDNAADKLRICIAGHAADYDLPGWDCVPWKRLRVGVNGSSKTRDQERLWFSPGCQP